MPQQLLHAAQIAARLQHMGGKGVAQLVRVHMAVQPLLNAPLGESLLYVARRNTFAQLRQNSASSSVPNRPRKSSQCSIHATALRPIGKRRSLLPLPITQTSPLSRSRCLISRLTSSDKRNPAPYITSSIARSRTASGSLRSISSSRLTSSTSIFFGRWREFSARQSPSPDWR